ncbi:MAG TPA: PBP1A family penicillin-binding protein [Anaerolineae bacterium]|nr:PBP1A family penicillin-binding protein [Anaerolineae bacterium]
MMDIRFSLHPTLLRAFQRALAIVLVLGLLLSISPPRPTQAESDPAPPPDAARVIELITSLSGEEPFQTTRIYDRRGILLADIDDRGRRTIVGYNEIPDIVIQATIATEDRRFFQHQGIDYLAIVRALWQNTQSETIVSGGSTITQQLARILFLSPSERYEQSIQRKLKEVELAQFLETYYTKEEILAMYLNMVYYGNQAYGIAAAAEVYFNKSLSELTLAEAALLAGLPQAPAMYDPFRYPERALERQRTVISLMQEAGFLTSSEADALRAQPVLFHPYQRPRNRAPHFVNYIRDILIERFGTEGIHRGYQVHTSLDLRYQALAERIARAQVKRKGKKYRFSNAAVVIIQPQSGGILAMVGSIDFNDKKIAGQVNMTTVPRQPGSAIKPIVYAAAFERGWSPASIIWDLPVYYTLDGRRRYAPRNITGRFYGPLRLRMALANSLNVPAVKLLQAIGIPAVLETAEKLGIKAWRQPQDQYGLSLAVGGYEVPLLELTHAFATIANQGVYTPLYPITEIRDGAGRVVFQAKPRETQRQAISPLAAYQLTSILSDARARRMMFPRPSPLDTSQITAVKTGTTDGWRDNLTVGFTSYLAVGVWIGNTNNKPMRNAVGVYTAGPIWHDVMEAIWADESLYDALGYADGVLPQGFILPPDTVTIPVCDWLPGKFTPRCPRMVEEVYPASLPTSLPTGRDRGYCLPAGAAPSPPEAYFLPLPKDTRSAAAARNWVRKRFLRAVQHLNDCDTTPNKRPLVKQPKLLPPRQWVLSAEKMKTSVHLQASNQYGE